MAENSVVSEVMHEPFIQRQVIPLALTIIIFGILVVVLAGEILALNHFTDADILFHIRPFDILIGLTIYLKTSIDFAIFMGRLMDQFGGWKNRIAIEIGTAVGNAGGTMIVLAIWAFFKEVEILLAAMIFLAALVLFRLAEEGLEHADAGDNKFPKWFQFIVTGFSHALAAVNAVIAPVLKYVVPNLRAKVGVRTTFWSLFAFSFSVPFILGLDDFAGYVPLFSIVSVFGFAIGVFLGHMILNIFLYLNPAVTIRIVKNPIISFLGSVAFVGLGVWGLIEVFKILMH